jgi:two-component system secretion response regulator SsrB
MREEPLSCVLLADRQHGLTEGVRGLLETAFATVVMVADEVSLLEGASRLRPDVAVVDLSLAQSSGLDWLRALRERCPGLKVIVLSVHDEQSVRRAALEAGADAFVLKSAIATDLLPAVAFVRGEQEEQASTHEGARRDSKGEAATCTPPLSRP